MIKSSYEIRLNGIFKLIEKQHMTLTLSEVVQKVFREGKMIRKLIKNEQSDIF
jgi:hypothetical protein